MGVFPVTPASLAAQPSTSPWTWWGHGLSSVAPPAPTVPEERGRLPDPHGACGHCACARTPRGLGPRTLPWPSGRPPARAGPRGRQGPQRWPSFAFQIRSDSCFAVHGGRGHGGQDEARARPATLQARERRGRGGRTRPGPGRPASEPARTGLGFQTRRQAAVPPPLSQDGAVATATKALARDGSRGRRTRGRRWAAEARSARRAGRRGRTDGALGPNPGAGSFPAPHTPRSSRQRGAEKDAQVPQAHTRADAAAGPKCRPRPS